MTSDVPSMAVFVRNLLSVVLVLFPDIYILLLLLLLLLTAIGFIPGGSVQYTSTKKTQTLDKKKKKNKKKTIQYNTITRNRKIKSNHTEQKTNTRQVIPTYKTIR
jgi:uncharacterized ion transporter superfamily protein YfcC